MTRQTAQAHRINIEAGQPSVFEALSTAEGWSRWFTPEVTGDFTDGSQIVCRLNGAAAGLGASIALLCDVIVANETALIGDPHVRVGLVAGDGGAVIWPQLVGFARAKEFLMTGEMLSARRAADIGLINYAVSGDQLDSKVAEVVGKILANPRWAVRWTKTAANIPLKMLANQISDAAIAYEILSNLTKDRGEAVAAFVEKRKPVFSGE